MKNFKQEGDTLSLIAPSGGVTSGIGVLIGAIFVVAQVTAAAGLPFSGRRVGVIEHAAATHATTQAMSPGDIAYWDATAKLITKTAAGNTPVGVVTKAKVSTVAVVDIVLVPRLAAAGGAIADLALAALTGVDGTGSNAAPLAGVNTAFTALNAKINAIITALELAGIVVA